MLNTIFLCSPVYDASVKEPSGVEYGDTYQFGNFDECLNVFGQQKRFRADSTHSSSSESTTGSNGHHQPSFDPLFCLADVTLLGYAIAEISSRNHHIQVNPISMSFSILNSPMQFASIVQLTISCHSPYAVFKLHEVIHQLLVK